MHTDKLNKWLALVANLGVIAGIISLAIEIQQSNQIAIASNEIAIRQLYAAGTESVYENADMPGFLAKVGDPDAVLTDRERVLGIYYVSRLFNTWNAIERAYATGMVSVTTLSVAKDDIRVMVESYPALEYAFRDVVDGYPSYNNSEIHQTVSRLLNELEPNSGE